MNRLNSASRVAVVCNTMMMDGVKNKEKENDVQVLDVAEMIAASML